MRLTLRDILIALLCAVAFGRLAWRTWGPASNWADRFTTSVGVLHAQDPDAKCLYLRKAVYLSSRPSAAWIQLLGNDTVDLYVNGDLVADEAGEKLPAVIVADLTPLLKIGKNVIAVACRQTILEHTPQVSVVGEVKFQNSVQPLDLGDWKHSTHYEQSSDYWFTLGYDDSHWSSPKRRSGRLSGAPSMPREPMSKPPLGRWIGPTELKVGPALFRHSFDLPDNVESAWLRFQTYAAVRIAINGEIAYNDESQLSLPPEIGSAALRLCNIAPFLRRGQNAIVVDLRAEYVPARFCADILWVGRHAQTQQIVTDAKWGCRSGPLKDWPQAGLVDTGWSPCCCYAAGSGTSDWETHRTIVPATRSEEWWWKRLLEQGTWIGAAGAGIVGWYFVACCLLLFLDRKPLSTPDPKTSPSAGGVLPASLCLILPTLICAMVLLMSFDPRFPEVWMFHSRWLLAAAILVPVQFVVWMVARLWQVSTVGTDDPNRFYVYLIRGLLVAVFVAGAHLRVRDVTTRPLTPDEITMYLAATNAWENGFPSLRITSESPPVYAATSELVHFGGVFWSMYFDDMRLIVRMMPMLFGAATVLLIYAVGSRLFDRTVGLAAAGLYATSPYCIMMSNSARYYSQLQFFTLLTVFSFYQTIRHQDGVRNKVLWGTVAAFACMFLSWEGSAIVALGLLVGALFECRQRLRQVLVNRHVWAGIVVLGALVVVQSSYRSLVQVQRPLYGSGASDISLTPMWLYPGYDPWYYISASVWNRDTLLPMLGLAAAIFFAVKHPNRASSRYLLAVFLTGCLVQASLLPVTASRYSYHFVPLFVLLASAGIVSSARWLADVGQSSVPAGGRFGRFTVAASVAVYVAAAGGLALDLAELETWRSGGAALDAVAVVGQEQSSGFLLKHLKPDDVVIVSAPHAYDLYLNRKTDFWLQTQLQFQATIDESSSAALHRYAGTPMLESIEQLRALFDRPERIWFLTEPHVYGKSNTNEAMEYLRANMNVVFEDYGTVVLVRDGDHRPAGAQIRNERQLLQGTQYLP